MYLLRLILVIALLITNSAQASESKSSSELIGILKNINTYQAEFTQVIYDANFKKINRTQGAILVKRPGLFYWEAYNPEPLIVVADGEYLYNYDPELEQAVKQNVAKVLPNSPASILAANINEFTNNFASSKVDSGCNDSLNSFTSCFTIEPINQQQEQTNSLYKIFIGLQNNNIAMVKMQDMLGQTIVTNFNKITQNQEINSQKFKFKLPKGVDLIDKTQDE